MEPYTELIIKLVFKPFTRFDVAAMMVLQVAVAGSGHYAALVTGAKGTTVLYYASTSELNAYWQSSFPNRPIPSAILAHFNAPSGISLPHTQYLHTI